MESSLVLVLPWPKILRAHSKLSTMKVAQLTQPFSQHSHPMVMHCNRSMRHSDSQRATVSFSNVTLNIVWDHVSQLCVNGDAIQLNHGAENVVQLQRKYICLYIE